MERAASELSQVIRTHFSLHPARVACLLAMIWGVIGAKRVQLWALGEQFGGSSLLESRIKRIQRFLREQKLEWDIVAQCIIKLAGISGQWTLVMDRTNWQFGKIERNYLVLAIVYHRCAIPLLVKDLARAGNSDTLERIALMERFLKLFGKEKIFCLLADREFIGEEWFKWLKNNHISPCIRMRNNTLVKHRNGGKVPVSTLLRDLEIGQYRTWEEKLYGSTLQMVGMKIAGGDYLILLAATELSVPLLPLYKVRWTIECLFKNEKSSGFLWETTHLVHAERAEKLASILALATVIVVKEGALQHALKPILFKKTVASPLCSFFLYGLRILADNCRSKITNTINNPLILFGCYKSVP